MAKPTGHVSCGQLDVRWAKCEREYMGGGETSSSLFSSAYRGGHRWTGVHDARSHTVARSPLSHICHYRPTRYRQTPTHDKTPATKPFFINAQSKHSTQMFLCGPTIGHIMPLVRPSVPYGLVPRKQKKRRKIKNGIDVPQGTSKWGAIFR